jgi:hypothetical protein
VFQTRLVRKVANILIVSNSTPRLDADCDAVSSCMGKGSINSVGIVGVDCSRDIVSYEVNSVPLIQNIVTYSGCPKSRRDSVIR